jgi:hypothetical protein
MSLRVNAKTGAAALFLLLLLAGCSGNGAGGPDASAPRDAATLASDAAPPSPDGSQGALDGSVATTDGATGGAYDGSGFPYVLGDTLYPYDTTLAKPAKAGSYADPVFHTTVTRITDHATDNGGAFSRAGVEYSTWSPLSSNGKYLAFEGGQGGYGIWHADAPYAFYKDVSAAAAGYNGQNAELRWDQSGAHPTWFYYRKDQQLRRFDVETDQDALVRDFSADLGLGASYYIYNGDEGTCSDDSRVWAWVVKNASSPYDEARVLVWDQTADAVNIKDVSAFGGANSVKVSPSGNYLMIAYNPADPYTGEGRAPYLYDISGHATANSAAMFATKHQWNGNIPHDAWAVTKQGHEVIVGLQPNGNHVDKMTMVRGDNGALYELYAQADMDPQWSGEGVNHMTGPSTRPGWAFMSTYSDNGAKAQAAWTHAQIWAFELDETRCLRAFTSYADTTGTACAGKPRIWRIAFEQSFTGADYYFQQPNAAIDKGGTRIWFGSNWRDMTVASMDVYQVTLPASWSQDLQ